MDVMEIKDFLIVGVPETTLCVIIAFQLLKGSDWFKEYIIETKLRYAKSKFLKLIFRNKKILDKISFFMSIISIVFFNIILLTGIFFVRMYSNSYVISIPLNVLLYILCFMLIFKMRFIQAFIITSLLMLNTIFTESIFITPMYYIAEKLVLLIEYLINNYNETGIVYSLLNTIKSANKTFYDYRFSWTFPTRISQIFIIIIFYKNNISFKNNILFVSKWRDLSKFQKKIVYIIIVFLTTTLVINANYIEFTMKINENSIDENIFNINLVLLMIATVFNIISTIVLLIDVFDKEKLAHILYRSSDSLFEYMVKVATKEEVNKFKNILANYKIGEEVYESEKNV